MPLLGNWGQSMTWKAQAVVPGGHGRLATSSTTIFDTGEESIGITSFIMSLDRRNHAFRPPKELNHSDT